MEKIKVNEIEYEIILLLGKGKCGYSYLVTDGNARYVVKQIHHEPCDYYNFGDKLQSELDAYEFLKGIGIRMPKLLDYDKDNERILKEFIDGSTIEHLVQNDMMKKTYFTQMEEMCKDLYINDTNIDYYPTNFVVQDDLIWYIDYEYNKYSDKWNFENWGSQYWHKK